MMDYFNGKVLPVIKQYYLYIFAVLLLMIISLVKIVSNHADTTLPKDPNVLSSASTLKVEDTSIASLNTSVISLDTNDENTEQIKKEIYIDLSGAVINPGIYIVPDNSRVGDVIAMGGGLSKNASALWVSRNINFSKIVSDTQKIYIPFDWETYGDCSCIIDTLSLNIPNLPKTFVEKNSTSNNKSPNSTNANYEDNGISSSDTSSVEVEDISGDTNSTIENASKVNVNTATKDQLDTLPGIGPSYAQKIIDNRPYTTLTDLTNKSGIPKGTLDKISSEISF